MNAKPQRAKLHSQQVADEYVALGWKVTHAFWAARCDEPYEIIVVWPGPGEPVWPDGMWRAEQRQAEPGVAADRGA